MNLTRNAMHPSGGISRLDRGTIRAGVNEMDRMDWAVTTFKQANRKTFAIPFSHFMRKQGKVDPLEAAPVLRNMRSKNK